MPVNCKTKLKLYNHETFKFQNQTTPNFHGGFCRCVFLELLRQSRFFKSFCLWRRNRCQLSWRHRGIFNVFPTDKTSKNRQKNRLASIFVTRSTRKLHSFCPERQSRSAVHRLRVRKKQLQSWQHNLRNGRIHCKKRHYRQSGPERTQDNRLRNRRTWNAKPRWPLHYDFVRHSERQNRCGG